VEGTLMRLKMPLKMRLPWPQGFQGRLLAAFATLLVFAVATTGVALSISSAREVDAQMHARLETGTRVLMSHLDARAEQLAAAVTVLTRDFGFKGAVASGDQETLRSTLANHGERIGASLMVLVDRANQVISPDARAGNLDGLKNMVNRALAEGLDRSYAVGSQGDALYQFFVMPVLAPEPVGWMVIAFEIDAPFIAEISTLTELEAAFFSVDGEGAVHAVAPTAAFDHVQALVSGLPASEGLTISSTHDDQYLTAIQAIGEHADQQVYAVLGLPNSLIAETIRFQLLQVAIILLVALVLVGAGGLTMARRMAAPVDRLIRTARVIERGDYDAEIATDLDGELKTLGSAMHAMRAAIREREQRIVHQATHDPLTGLPNRRRLEQCLNELITPYGVCMLAVTDLADITYGLGNEARDAYLRGMADRLAAIPGVSCVTRFSRDEFALVLPASTPEETLQHTRALHHRASQPVTNGQSTVLGHIASACIRFPDDAERSDLLLRRLDSTLASARNDPERCLAFHPDAEKARARQLAILSGFTAALERGEFFLLFQPKVSLPTMRVKSCEALLRWVHPEFGFVPPDEFIQLAERSGQIRQLTDRVLDMAIAAAARLRTGGLEIRVAINLSVHDVMDPLLPDVVQRRLEAHGVPAHAILLEVTESAVMEDGERALQTLLALRNIGIRLSIDDFGTGHSSLGRLKDLPVDELKIDKSFVLKLDQSPEDALIVSSTIRLGHDLGLNVVAEGVENRDSLEILLQSGCDVAQGYFFSKPLKVDDLVTWVKNFHAGDSHGQEAVA
jgi:diguanylate cyclase (GGDEF)-like protein